MSGFLFEIWKYFTGIFNSDPSSNEDNGSQSVFVDYQEKQTAIVSRDLDIAPDKNQIRIRKFCQNLWKIDKKRRLVVGEHIQLSTAGVGHLFDDVDKSSLENILPKHFVKVLSFYHSDLNAHESYDERTISQQFQLIDSIMGTDVMKHVTNILIHRRPADIEVFRCVLWNLWFKLYDGRCAFKHIFCGETVHNSYDECLALGLHNWIQYYLQEYQGNIHTGIKHRIDGNVVTTSFVWNGCIKEKDSFFVGTTPAFEFALYTYLYYVDTKNRRQEFNMKFDDNFVVIQVNRGRGKDQPPLLTAFPEIY